MAIIDDPLLAYGNPLELLATPNYLLLTGIVSLAVSARWAFAKRIPFIRLVGIAAATYYALEIGRWVYTAWRFSQQTGATGFLYDPLTYLILTCLLLPTASITYFAHTATPRPAPPTRTA